MSTVLVNGNATATGCYIDGHWGWRGTARTLEIAEDLGYPRSEGDRAMLADEDSESYMDDAVFLADKAEAWLNDHTAEGFVWYWHDGEFFLAPMCEDGDCDDETCAHWD